MNLHNGVKRHTREGSVPYGIHRFRSVAFAEFRKRFHSTDPQSYRWKQLFSRHFHKIQSWISHGEGEHRHPAEKCTDLGSRSSTADVVVLCGAVRCSRVHGFRYKFQRMGKHSKSWSASLGSVAEKLVAQALTTTTTWHLLKVKKKIFHRFQSKSRFIKIKPLAPPKSCQWIKRIIQPFIFQYRFTFNCFYNETESLSLFNLFHFWLNSVGTCTRKCLKVCALPCYSMVDRLIDWLDKCWLYFFPFFVENHLRFRLHFCFIRKMIIMPIVRLKLAEFGRFVSGKCRFLECADFEAYPRTQSINQPLNNMRVRRLWSKSGVICYSLIFEWFYYEHGIVLKHEYGWLKNL